MDDPRIAAAIIAGVVSLTGVVVSFLTTRWLLKAKVVELEQLQLKEVLAKRMEAYPKLWQVLLTYGRNWIIEGKARNADWAREFENRHEPLRPRALVEVGEKLVHLLRLGADLPLEHQRPRFVSEANGDLLCVLIASEVQHDWFSCESKTLGAPQRRRRHSISRRTVLQTKRHSFIESGS
jgi:hypothetical protein